MIPEVPKATPGSASSFSTLRRSKGLARRPSLLSARRDCTIEDQIDHDSDARRLPGCSLSLRSALVLDCRRQPPRKRRERQGHRVKDVLKTYADIAQAGYTDVARHRADLATRGRTSCWRSRPRTI